MRSRLHAPCAVELLRLWWQQLQPDPASTWQRAVNVMVKAWLLRVGVVTNGMDGWLKARAIFDGSEPWVPAPLPRFKPLLLPANERRRATVLVQLALRAVEDCLIDAAPADPASVDEVAAPASPIAFNSLASVFASSGGDMGNLHGLCEQLVRDPKGISPTAFHNSVHNAVAGYFGIGAVARAASVSLAAHDHSFLAGMQEAMAWVADQQSPVLLVVYDMVAPQPLFDRRPVRPEFAVALLLAPVDSPAFTQWRGHALAELTLTQVGAPPAQSEAQNAAEQLAATQMTDPAFEALRTGNPAARVR